MGQENIISRPLIASQEGMTYQIVLEFIAESISALYWQFEYGLGSENDQNCPEQGKEY